ncbi:hypothetical protein FOZ62_031088, partial [Perkinsus olseni]
MSSASSQAHARALVRQARAAAESGGGGTGATAPTSIRGVSLCTQIPGVADAVICVLCKKRVKTGRMWAIHSKIPQHQHLLQRLELALLSKESQPAQKQTEAKDMEEDEKPEEAGEEPRDAGLLGAGYSDDDDGESEGEGEEDKTKKEETPPVDDVIIPPPRKAAENEVIGPIPANEDLLDTDDIRNYVTAELAGLVVSGTEFEYDDGDAAAEGGKGKRKRRPAPKKKKSLATSALPEGFFDDEDKAAEVFGREAPSKRRSKD